MHAGISQLAFNHMIMYMFLNHETMSYLCYIIFFCSVYHYVHVCMSPLPKQ